MAIRYELIPPAEPCIHPDGHDKTEAVSYASPIPEDVVCAHCGQSWTIVVFDDQEEGHP